MRFDSASDWEEHSATARRLESDLHDCLHNATAAAGFSTGFAALTPTERVIALHLKFGLSNKEIAHALRKSEPTVKNQVAAVLRKLSVASRARLSALLWSAEWAPAPLACVVCSGPSAPAGDGDLRASRAVDTLRRPAFLAAPLAVSRPTPAFIPSSRDELANRPVAPVP